MNSLARGGSPSLDGFLYLTYFNQFPPDTLANYKRYDKPLIGEVTYWGASGSSMNEVPQYALDNWGPGYTGITAYNGIPGIYPSAIANSGIASTDNALLSLVNRNDTVSVEGIFNISNSYDSRGKPWGDFSLGSGSQIYVAGFNDYQGSRGRGIGYAGTASPLYTNPDFEQYWVDGSNVAYFFPKSSSWKHSVGIHHFAFVFDRDAGNVRLYFDGVHVATSPDIKEIDKLSFRNSSIYVGIQFTQFAIRRGDCSINGGAEYPVPQTPYVSNF